MVAAMAQPVKYQGVDKESSGYKLLAAMGWQEGSGLGARQQGVKEHVKVKKKHDVTGVGALEAVAKARDWTAGMAAYDLVLAKMKPVSAAQDRSSKEPSTKIHKKKRKQPEPDIESAAAAPQPTKAKTVKTKPKKNKKQAETTCSPDAETSTIMAPQAQQPVVMPAVASAPAQQAKGRHVGRYHRVAAAKKAKGYSSSDLAAVLGLTALPTAPSAAVPITQDSSEDTCYQQEPAIVAFNPPAEHNAQQQAASRQPEEFEQQHEHSDDSKQWWHGSFVKAGRMGNMADDVLQHGPDKEVKINGFSEQDQENLYMATHLGKTSGKKGLGKSTQPKDIGGVKWAGKKTLLEDTEAQNDGECGNAAEAATDDCCTAQAAEIRAASAVDPAKTVEPSVAGTKWKKRAKRLLAGAPAGKMKLKKLQNQLLQQSQCPQTAWDAVGSQIMAQLATSKQFQLTQTSVTLMQ